MPIDPISERPIPFHDVPTLAWLPRRRRGRKLHYSTVYRWYRRGVRGIRLEAICVGGTLCTSEAAITRFFHRLAEAETHAAPAEARTGNLDRVSRELQSKGL